MPDAQRHIPVLQTTVLEILKPESNESVIDVTLGLGGHAMSFLEKTGPAGTYTGIDADTSNIEIARGVLAPFRDRVRIIHENFRHIAGLMLPPADIVFADLGVSSPHFDDPERGFSFRFDGPLDLRFDRTRGKTAAEMLEAMTEKRLIQVLQEYGELSGAPAIARAIKVAHPVTTTDVRRVLDELLGYRAPQYLPQVFQALRIAVNDELGALEALLATAPALLKPGGRLGIISFHSLEDRMVKHTLRTLCANEKDPITGKVAVTSPFSLLTKKAVVPSEEEATANPRSRSAKFRAIVYNPS